MWCSSSDSPRPHGGSQPHHRIVRIPPGESVVLNSAERAPYVLLIEILNDELDFDPSKRANKDILKKIVIKENERKGASKDLIPFNNLTPIQHAKSNSGAYGDLVDSASTEYPLPPIVVPATPTSTTMTFEEEEEIDLVEQLYGADQSLRSRPVDISDSIVLPPTPKNKELDMAAWSRPPSIPPSPSMDNSVFTSTILAPPTPGVATPLSANGHTHSLSLDEYSERMRTAAIMLAQLNASISARESAPAVSPAEPTSSWGPMGWLPGSNWLTVTPPVSASSPMDHHLPSRMRLQPADASGIRERIMQEMLSLEEERMERMRENRDMETSIMRVDNISGMKTAEDEGIIRRELNKADPSAVVFSESWTAKKVWILRSVGSNRTHASIVEPDTTWISVWSSWYAHLVSLYGIMVYFWPPPVNWDCVSVIVKTGGDLRQEQLATQLIREFQRIWTEENCQCWAR